MQYCLTKVANVFRKKSTTTTPTPTKKELQNASIEKKTQEEEEEAATTTRATMVLIASKTSATTADQCHTFDKKEKQKKKTKAKDKKSDVMENSLIRKLTTTYKEYDKINVDKSGKMTPSLSDRKDANNERSWQPKAVTATVQATDKANKANKTTIQKSKGKPEIEISTGGGAAAGSFAAATAAATAAAYNNSSCSSSNRTRGKMDNNMNDNDNEMMENGDEYFRLLNTVNEVGHIASSAESIKELVQQKFKSKTSTATVTAATSPLVKRKQQKQQIKQQQQQQQCIPKMSNHTETEIDVVKRNSKEPSMAMSLTTVEATAAAGSKTTTPTTTTFLSTPNIGIGKSLTKTPEDIEYEANVAAEGQDIMTPLPRSTISSNGLFTYGRSTQSEIVEVIRNMDMNALRINNLTNDDKLEIIQRCEQQQLQQQQMQQQQQRIKQRTQRQQDFTDINSSLENMLHDDGEPVVLRQKVNHQTATTTTTSGLYERRQPQTPKLRLWVEQKPLTDTVAATVAATAATYSELDDVQVCVIETFAFDEIYCEMVFFSF